MGAFCRSKCKILQSSSVSGPRTHPTRAAPRTAARIGVTVGSPYTDRTTQRPDSLRIYDFQSPSPMRNRRRVVRRCFALRFRLSRVRFPRSRSARAPCTGYNHPFTGSLCLKGKIVTKFQAPARARLERAPRGFDPAWEMLVPAAREPNVRAAGQRGGRTANQDRRSMCRSFHESAWRQDARFAVRSTAQRARNLTRHSSV
jgi:hypothetical protein